AILQIRLEDREVLVLSGADLKDYYYHFVISRQRLLRNALAGSVSEATARTFSCFESHLIGKGPFRAALNSMAMGDLNSVEFGQLSHLSLSLQADVFRPEEMLTLKSRAPRTPIAGGVVIDDLFLAEKMDRSQVGELGKGTSAGALRLKRAEKAYVEGGLLQNFKKSFSEQLKAEVWGAEIDGDAGTCRPLTSRLIPVISITVDILQTKEVFKAPRWLDEHKAFRIWPALEELPGGDQFGYHPVWQTLFRSVKFNEVWRRRIWRPRHINVHELRTLLAAERRRGLQCPASSVVSASDSQVSLGAVLKGRSASPRLNGILRQSLPEHLSADISGIYAYVGTSDNPADDPTRHAKVRDPREAMPRWMEHALGGMFDELEEFLRSYDLDTVSMLGLPPFESIVPLAVPAPKPSREDARALFLRELGKPGEPLEAEALARSLLLRATLTAENLLELSRLLPREAPARGPGDAEAGSFSGGAFVHGGVTGVRRNSRSFPSSEQVVAKFAAEHYPDHEYTSFVFLTNLKTPAHRDSHNSASSLNMIVKLSPFSGGEIWVADSGGEEVETINGKEVRGRNLAFDNGVVFLRPRSWHLTREWSGERVVLVFYCIRDYLKLARADAELLSAAGYNLPKDMYKKFRSLKPPPVSASAGPVGSLVARKDYELEQRRRVDETACEGCVFDLHPHITDVLLKFDSEQFVLPKKSRKRLSELLLRPGYLDLYSGSAGVAHELAAASGTWVLTFDYARSAAEDLLEPGLQQTLLELTRLRAFAGLGAGPVCSSFSRAIRPPVRDKANPLGLPGLRSSMYAKVMEGNQHAEFVAALVSEFQLLSLPYWVENPHGSYFWEVPSIKNLLGEPWRDSCWVLDYCAFGTAWRKRTRFFVGRELGGQEVRCPGCREHQRLVGYSSYHRRQWTKVAEVYPRAVNSLLAHHLANSSRPVGLRKRLDLAACARCLGARIGEATNPGPRPRQPHHGSLEEVNLVTETTVKLQNRVLADFEGWLRSGLSDSALSSLSSCAMAYCTMIRAYGDHLYRSKGPMYVYRHLLAYMQKNRLGLRPYLPMAWDLLSRWERVEPVQHRVPMPEALYKAMFALGLLRGWFRWCSIFGIAYHGIARAGEPLRALRKDLLLPSDTLSPLATGSFMAVRGPKTAYRGKGRVQHLCIKDASFSAFLEYVYSRVPPEERLYRGSASAFRKRWDELLLLLSVPKAAGLTPGGLRGGGAVKAYKEGVGIQDLMWRMRVRHAVTLESYLQEVAALSVVPKLPPESRRRVTAACVFYQPALLAFSTAVVNAF
ncbi:unnamed protein product, partial [Symbiodinium sp. CCMP2456]